MSTPGPEAHEEHRSFGPSALLTPANVITIARLLVAPVAFWMIVQQESSWPLWVLWALLTTTDSLDGYLARRQGTTRSGAFLDPLADKVLVLGALGALVVVDRFSIVPVLLIAFRELAISVYRTQLGRQGLAVPARPLGKAKTIVQELAIAMALFPPLENHTGWSVAVLWISVGLTYVSGAQYLLDGRSAATTLGHRTPSA